MLFYEHNAHHYVQIREFNNTWVKSDFSNVNVHRPLMTHCLNEWHNVIRHMAYNNNIFQNLFAIRFRLCFLFTIKVPMSCYYSNDNVVTQRININLSFDLHPDLLSGP